MDQTQEYRIVVGVDFSSCGNRALEHAIRCVMQQDGAELHAAHVITEAELRDVPGADRLERLDHILEETPGRLWAVVERAARRLLGGLPARRLWVHVRVGEPAATLVQVAADYDAKLLIVGTHGRRGLDRLLLGSVAERLSRSAPCPLLIARETDYAAIPRTPHVDASWDEEEPAKRQGEHYVALRHRPEANRPGRKPG